VAVAQLGLVRSLAQMPSHMISIRTLICGISFMTLCGCRSRVEEFYILTNDSGSGTLVSDCFVKVLSQPGHLPGQYENKDFVLIFRDGEHKPFLKKRITLWAAEIKPSIDWKEFPKVRISLQSNGQESAYFVTVPTKRKETKLQTN
jgi:hypothetical protein